MLLAGSRGKSLGFRDGQEQESGHQNSQSICFRYKAREARLRWLTCTEKKPCIIQLLTSILVVYCIYFGSRQEAKCKFANLVKEDTHIKKNVDMVNNSLMPQSNDQSMT